MEVIKTVAELQQRVAAYRKDGARVGFLPTMGALHNGHIRLAERCVKENDCSVVSIFVNPTQFNDRNDLLKYPRMLENDVRLLEAVGVKLVFAPSVEEVYPQEDTRVFDFGTVDKVMEGKYRPGHFNGVAQVVSRLFEIVKPDRAYFGEKDFQQIAVIRAMVKQLNLPVEIIACPIVREGSGLALSSRNALLTDGQRKNAVKISEVLENSRTFARNHTVAETIREVIGRLNAEPDLRVEYFEIVDGEQLTAVSHWSDSSYIVGCITVFCGAVRLIDNVKY